MKKPKSDQVIHLKSRATLRREVDAFVVDRQARGLSDHTILFYRRELKYLGSFLDKAGVTDIVEITTDLLRRYLLDLGTHRNPGGIHAAYRALRAFFGWYEEEVEGQEWRNPVDRLRPPKVPVEPLEPVPVGQLQAMLATCKKDFMGVRDRAILLTLLDTGCRGSELVALNVGDLNMATNAILVRKAKAKKPRVVIIGVKCQREISRYLRARADGAPDESPLWLTVDGKRLTFFGLRQVVRRRAERAGLPEPGLHSFRRAFALMSLRNGIDIYSLQKLMGHADLTVLRRYLAQTEDDLRAAHEKSSPVDNML